MSSIIFKSLLKNQVITGKILKDSLTLIPSAGVKYFPPPIKYDHIEFPENRKLRFTDKAPTYPPTMRPPTMQKRLRFMRGPELVHNELIHKQFGIVALTGGRMRWNHFEMVRMTLNRKVDPNRMFVEWRIDPPWQAVSKKGIGVRGGGGKGPIDHYVTPLKQDRIVLELGGKLEWPEAQKILYTIVCRLPFKCELVSQKMMQKKKRDKIFEETQNQNKYTMKYIIQNNMAGCNNWLSTYDYQWYGKYL